MRHIGAIVLKGLRLLARVQQHEGIETVRVQGSLLPLFLSFPLDFFLLSSLFSGARSYLGQRTISDILDGRDGIIFVDKREKGSK